MKSKYLPLIAVLMTSLLLPITSAAPAERYEAEWDWDQTYNGWGPALYYGEDVRVIYEATNSWTIKHMDNGDGTWDVQQTLTQDGVAYIYDLSENLLDTGKFRVTEVTTGTVSYMATWYGVWSFDYVDSWEYHWIISGVYHYRGTAMDMSYYGENMYWMYQVPGYPGWTQIYP